MFALAYSNQDNNSKRCKTFKYYLPKDIIKNYNVLINGRNFYDQPIDPDIKWYEEIRKLTTGQGEEYTTRCLLDYEYIKNNYKLIAVDLSTQKELDADPKTIQQIEFVRQLLNENNQISANESMFVFKVTTKILSRKCNSLIKYGKLWGIKS